MKKFSTAALVACLLALVACAKFEQAVAAPPGAKCKPTWVECTDQWGSCCPPGQECRAPIPDENRGPFCGNVDDPHGWVMGAKSRVARTPKGAP